MHQEIALNLLRDSLGDPNVQFRSGQWEAIDKLVNERKRLLVVQRTGWGKSAVYFISAKLLREQGRGPTLIISPLLALMRNQLDGAQKLGIRAATINSANTREWESVKDRVLKDEVDALLISPERLSNEDFVQDVLLPISERLGMFVVDEAHCISDWGHDFRPDYKRIVNILKVMPRGMPVLGTTATANNRVVDDIVSQLGNIEVIRGSLMRKSLVLQNIRLRDQASRLAWLAEVVPTLPGSGIIYTLTTRDAERVSDWLVSKGIQAAAYHAGITHEDFPNSNAYRLYLEDALYENRIKVLVATTAIGMGYDKPDLSFVIHYQAPGSIISYYQQVGRAGRAIDRAYGVLLSGQEDKDIHDFFRRNAFPPESRVKRILQVLEDSDGLSLNDLKEQLNYRHGQLEQALKYLSVADKAPVVKINRDWHRTTQEYEMDHESILRLTRQREQEWTEVQNYIDHEGCLMQFLQGALDDKDTGRCGRCAGCKEAIGLPIEVDNELGKEAALFLRHSEFPLRLRKRIPGDALTGYGLTGGIPVEALAEEGRVLSRWQDAGWGRVVADGKHKHHFGDDLVEALAEMIEERWMPEPAPQWLTCVPSLRHPELVPDFARRLAKRLNIPFVEAITKVRETEPQKAQENSYHQARNLDGAFEISEIMDGPVLLIDDAVDSKWTLTIASMLLRMKGTDKVFPVALTSTTAG